MIFPVSTGSSSSQSPLPATLLDLYLDENNNSNLNNSSHSSIVAALMAVAATVPSAVTSSSTSSSANMSAVDTVSGDGIGSSSPIARLPLTAMALKHALYGGKSSCLSSHHQCHHHHHHHYSRHQLLHQPHHPHSNNNSCSSSPSSHSVSSAPSSPTLPIESQSPPTQTMMPSSPLKRARPSSPQVRSIKRALFVDKSEIDHDANLALVKEQLLAQQQMSAKRWNFDFESGRPSPSSEQDHLEWSPLMPTASTTCPATTVIKPDLPVKRKLSISDYFTTTKKLKLVCKQLDTKSSTSSSDEASTADKSVCSSPVAAGSSTTITPVSSFVGRDVQVIRCLSPLTKSLGSDSKIKSFTTSTSGTCSKRPAMRSRSRSKRPTRSPDQCKKQLKL